MEKMIRLLFLNAAPIFCEKSSAKKSISIYIPNSGQTLNLFFIKKAKNPVPKSDKEKKYIILLTLSNSLK